LRETSLPPADPLKTGASSPEDAGRSSFSDTGKWWQWVLPSVEDLVFAGLLFSLILGASGSRLLRDGGTGWHIRTGELILKSGAIPRADSFSLSMKGHPWFAWEWLYDALAGGIFQRAGLNGIVVLTAILIATTVLLLFREMRRQGDGLVTTMLFIVLALWAAAVHMTARPHVFSWLLTLIWWRVLERAREEPNAHILWWLPALMLFWVNTHGGFLVGFVLLAIYLVDALWQFWRGRTAAARRWLIAMTTAGVASGLATLINPYGYRLHVHIVRYLSDPFLMQHIDEFRSPNFHGIAERCFLLLVALVVAGMIGGREQLRLRDALTVLFAAWSGFYAARSLPISAILLSVAGGKYFAQVLREWVGRRDQDSLWARWAATASRLGQMDERLRGHIWALAAVALAVGIAANGGTLAGRHVMDATFPVEMFPVQAMDFLEKSGERTAVYTPDQWGSYLIFRGYPGVLVDDRHDMYGDDFFRRHIAIMNARPGWEKSLAEVNANLVLVQSKSTLAGALEVAPGWNVRYRDPVAVLFAREPGSASALLLPK
jgi:hypothetical protein